MYESTSVFITDKNYTVSACVAICLMVRDSGYEGGRDCKLFFVYGGNILPVKFRCVRYFVEFRG